MLALAGSFRGARAQEATAPESPPASEQQGDEADRRLKNAFDESRDKAIQPTPNVGAADEAIDLLRLAQQGGIFMYPIYFFSFIVVLFGLERLFALRRRRIIPPAFVAGFGDLAAGGAGFDPRKAYKLCQQYPSTAANVIRAVLLKIGRPHSEVEQAVTMAQEREAAKLYNNVRPLNLAASAAPLLGLLGTVQGMIIAFHDTAHLPPGVNRAEFLAKGVYIALVTTFAGLCVAIPAVVISHYFEGKIQRLFRELDDVIYNLLPQLEQFEGKLRVSRKPSGAQGGATPDANGGTETLKRPAAARE
jgi:biopolymer transport protein ExbB